MRICYELFLVIICYKIVSVVSDYNDLEELVIAQEAYLQMLATRLNSSYSERCSASALSCNNCSYDGCSGTLPPDLSCQAPYAQQFYCATCPNNGVNASLTLSTVHVPLGDARSGTFNLSDTDTELTCLTATLFSSNDLNANPNASWFSFAAYTGLKRLFPGVPETIYTYGSQFYCENNDPRQESWYAAAATGAKNVILLIDCGSAMRYATSVLGTCTTRLDCAVRAFQQTLQTLAPTDWFSLVLFADNSATVQAYSQQLVRATVENCQAALIWLRLQVLQLSTKSGSSIAPLYLQAAQLVYAIFKQSNTPACQQVVIVQAATAVSSPTYTTSLLQQLRQMDVGTNAIWLTYAIEDTIPPASTGSASALLQQIACQFSGVHSQFSVSNDNFTYYADTVATFYYQLLAGGMYRQQAVAWGENFQFYPNYQQMVRASLPVYTTDTTNGSVFLLGVLALDVQYQPFLDALSDQNLQNVSNTVQQWLYQRSATACTDSSNSYQPSACYTQQFRAAQNVSVLCTQPSTCPLPLSALPMPAACLTGSITVSPFCGPYQAPSVGSLCCGINMCFASRLYSTALLFVVCLLGL